MKYIYLIFFLLFICGVAYASGMSNSGKGLSELGVSCKTITTGMNTSPQTATCTAGFYITGGICADSVAADAVQPTTVGGLSGSITCTAAAGNVNATAYCCQ